jgi:hypothetical protein
VVLAELLEVVPEIFLVLREQVLGQLLVDWATWISSETTHNSNNFVRLCNSSLRCLNPSYNKLVPATRNWHS